MSTYAVGSPPARWGRAWRHPLTGVSVASGATLVLVSSGFSPRAMLMAFVVAMLILVSVIDVERRILPNALVLPSAALVLAAHMAIDPGRAGEWVLAALLAAGALLVLSLINPAGMGLGDVKLALLLGAALGSKVGAALVVASLLVWPVALILLVKHGRGARRAAIPFGPFLALGAIAVILI
jgi:leader peptidase (prepilin peptidase)/N-methyltransferase